MFRTASTVEMLKPIALIAGLAILLWSLGLPSLRFADAASVSSFSDTLTDSSPSAPSDHDIQFTTDPGGTGVAANGEFIELTFPAGFDLSTIGAEDLDLLVASVDQDLTGGTNWTVSTTSTTIRFTTGSGVSVTAGDSVQIKIGLEATNSGSPDSQIVNPSSEGSFEITLASGASDTGATRVVILTAVTVTATVNTIFNFSVEGLPGGTVVNGATSTGAAASTSIPFGVLQAGSANATSAAQQLTVATNAANGYSVTVQVDQPFQSTTGAVIDGFDNGSDTASPVAWDSPDGLVGQPNTYGHWGLTSDDSDVFSVADTFIAASTTAREIMTHNGPVNGVGVGQGTTSVLYQVEISALQEAGDDYSTTLTYIATPVF